MGTTNTPRAADVQVGDVIAFTPTAEGADIVALYVTATRPDTDAARVLLSGGHFPRGVFADLFRSYLPHTHPVTLVRPTWVQTFGARALHIVEPGVHLTVCGRAYATPADGHQAATDPVCRTCTYRTVKDAAETERDDPAPFFYTLPE